jgi:DNA-binding response OmpR family regulator
VLLKIVYVDDEPGMCQMFIDNFASDTIKISVYTDPLKLLAEIEKLELDLIVLDYRLPNMNGDELAATLGNEVPKVLVSGDLNINLKQKFLRTFTKPFDFDEFDAFLHSFAAQKQFAT